jgi:signal transduction histidine kinase
VNSVTHDVNNMLGAIMAYAELVELTATLSDDEKRMMGEITGAVQKASALVGNLTDIARKEHEDVRKIGAEELANRVLELRMYEIKTSKIGFTLLCGDDLPDLMLDLPRAQQALMYLIGNAMDAALDADPKLIKLRVHAADGGVEYAVWNSGQVVPEGDRKKIFEPFFSTKGGEHVGLGLPLTQKYAAINGGSVRYDAERGFVLYLPEKSPFVARGLA